MSKLALIDVVMHESSRRNLERFLRLMSGILWDFKYRLLNVWLMSKLANAEIAK